MDYLPGGRATRAEEVILCQLYSGILLLLFSPFFFALSINVFFAGAVVYPNGDNGMDQAWQTKPHVSGRR